MNDAVEKQKTKLVLGTVQLGMDYGIANRTGMPDQGTAELVIRKALEGGIDVFDTAQAYGGSEKVLGKILGKLGAATRVRLISKLAPSLDHENLDELNAALERSLRNLDVEELYGLMLHDFGKFSAWNNGLGEFLTDGKKRGVFRHIGVSVYSPDQALEALDHSDITMVQVPSNVLDRRFENAGVFELAKKTGKELYIRSIYLQGLLFLDEERTPAGLKSALVYIEKLNELAGSFGLSVQEFCMAYARLAYGDQYIVVGAETPRQVRENIATYLKDYSSEIVESVRGAFKDVEERILNPSQWNVQA